MLNKDKIFLINERIKKSSNVVILTHLNPDHDSVGSTFALKEIIINNFNINATVYSEITPFYDFFVYNDSYNCIFNSDTLIIALDCANIERLSYSNIDVTKIIKIDHHPNIDKFGQIQIVDNSYSSTSELLVDICSINNWQINTNASNLLFLGIVGDTGRFLYKNVTENTYRVSKELISLGANPIKEIYPYIYNLTLNEIYLKSVMMSEFILENTIGYIIIDEKKMNTIGVTKNDISKLTNQFGSISELKSWIICIEENGKYKCSLRSKKTVINDIAQKYNGGGHPLASGVLLEDLITVKNLINDVKKKVQNDR